MDLPGSWELSVLLVLSLTYWEHPASHSAILLGMSVSQAHWFEAQFSLSELHAAQRSNWWPPILGLQPDWGFLWHLALQKRRKKTHKHTLKRSARHIYALRINPNTHGYKISSLEPLNQNLCGTIAHQSCVSFQTHDFEIHVSSC